MPRADAVREVAGVDQDRDIPGAYLGSAVGVALGIVDIVGIGDPAVLFLFVVVVRYIGVELIAISPVRSKDPIAGILTTCLGVESPDILVVEVEAYVEALPEVHPKVTSQDVCTLIGLEVLLVAYIGEGRLRIVEADGLGGIEHPIVAIQIEEVTDSAGTIEEELRLPHVVEIPLVGDTQGAELWRDVLEGVVRQRVRHLHTHSTSHVGDHLVGTELVPTDHLDLVGDLPHFLDAIGIVG